MSDAQLAALPAAAEAYPPQEYDGPARVLHWSAALVIIVTWGVGISLEAFPPGPSRGSVMALHSTLGLLALLLTVPRLLWRAAVPAPAAPGPAWLVAAARAGHAALYVFTLALPVTGLLARWARSGTATLLGGWSLPSPLPLPASKLWGESHVVIAFTLAALVAGHLAAVAYHQWVRRDGTLWRMAGRR